LAGYPREGGKSGRKSGLAGFPARLCRISGSSRILKKAGNPAGRISGTSLIIIGGKKYFLFLLLIFKKSMLSSCYLCNSERQK